MTHFCIDSEVPMYRILYFILFCVYFSSNEKQSTAKPWDVLLIVCNGMFCVCAYVPRELHMLECVKRWVREMTLITALLTCAWTYLLSAPNMIYLVSLVFFNDIICRYTNVWVQIWFVMFVTGYSWLLGPRIQFSVEQMAMIVGLVHVGIPILRMVLNLIFGLPWLF